MQIQVSPSLTVDYREAGQGAPVVLAHAFPYSYEMWEPQIAALQKKYRVIAPASRGFAGTSPFAGAPSIDQMADDLHDLLDAIQISEPIVLCGLSMGGYLALAFARKYPHCLRGLVLADTRAEPDDEAGKANRDKMIEFAATNSARDIIEQMLPKMLCEETRTSRPDVVGKVVAIASAQSPAAIAGALRALRDRPDARPTLNAIRVPTLVLVGAEDDLTPPAMAQTLAREIPQATLEIISAAGHISNLEQPEQFNRHLLNFLSTLP